LCSQRAYSSTVSYEKDRHRCRPAGRHRRRHERSAPCAHASLEDGFRQLIETQAGLDLYYVEQLYTFGNRFRTADEIEGGPRTLSVAYVALTREDEAPLEGTRWADWYEFLPWEDWRNGRPEELDSLIAPRLAEWCTKSRAQQARRNREERVNVTFGSSGASEMDGVLTLERLELLYDAGIMAEAERDHRAVNATCSAHPAKNIGTSMASDHRRVLATALGRIRGKLAYRPVVFELLPGEFTLAVTGRVHSAAVAARRRGAKWHAPAQAELPPPRHECKPR
jgi:hypothetical protein